MNKKILYLIVLLFVFVFNSYVPSFAISTVHPNTEKMTVSVEAEELEMDKFDIIKRITFRNKFKRSPKSQIESFYKRYTRYSEKNDVDKLKEMYSSHYVNNDGFDRETLFKLMEEASGAYQNVNYITDIIDIQVDDYYAVVKIHETATGDTSLKAEKINDFGYISSDLYYTNVLRKEDGKWKILSSTIDSEKIILKYGEAKKANFTISAPKVIPAGCEYDAAVNVEAPEGLFIVGSIVNEQIKFPQANEKDVLRAVKSKEFARILKSNTENNNEYATISLGFTRPHVGSNSVVIEMTGMAILMSRVNVIQVSNISKIEKESSNGKTTTTKSGK